MKKYHVSLNEMLLVREIRANIQRQLLREGGRLVCFTMNIPGEIKRTPLVRMLFDRGMAELNAGLDGQIKYTLTIDRTTGPEGYLLTDMPDEQVKNITQCIEEKFPAARLFDMDVIGDKGKLSRANRRKCLICSRPAVECARSRAHGEAAVIRMTEKLLRGYAEEMLSEAAYMSLLDELYTTPKPGLVDKNNNGAHSDMNVPLFEKSAEALKPYFRQAVRIGMSGGGMRTLREVGMRCEKTMFIATSGINTHKGIIYSMGLLLAGIGRSITEGGEWIENAVALARADIETRLKNAGEHPLTNGNKVYAAYGAKGAVGEAAEGFKTALFAADRLRDYSELTDTPGILVLCDIMGILEDTNILHRGGKPGLEFVQNRAKEIGMLPIKQRKDELYKMDKEMIERNLAPGGCADILALAYFMAKWEKISEDLFV